MVNDMATLCGVDLVTEAFPEALPEALPVNSWVTKVLPKNHEQFVSVDLERLNQVGAPMLGERTTGVVKVEDVEMEHPYRGNRSGVQNPNPSLTHGLLAPLLEVADETGDDEQGENSETVLEGMFENLGRNGALEDAIRQEKEQKRLSQQKISNDTAQTQSQMGQCRFTDLIPP